MACRYLEQRGNSTWCRACEPARLPSAEEQRTRCLDEPGPCPFHRFFRAAGRPLRIEDFRAWQKRPPLPPRNRKERT